MKKKIGCGAVETFTLKVTAPQWKLIYRALGIASAQLEPQRSDEAVSGDGLVYRSMRRLEETLSKQVIAQTLRRRGGT